MVSSATNDNSLAVVPAPVIQLTTPTSEAIAASVRYAESIVSQDTLNALTLMAETIEVNSDQSLADAEALILRIAETYKAVEEKCWGPLTAAAHNLHKKLVEAARPWRVLLSGEKEYKDKPENLRRKILRKILQYKEARQKAVEAEQKRLEAIAEEARKRAEEEAKKLMRRGNVAEAKSLLENAANIPIPVLAASAPQTKGISYTVTYSAEVEDFLSLLGGVIEGRVPVEAVQPNMAFINRCAREQREQLNWPGVRVVKTESIKGRV